MPYSLSPIVEWPAELRHIIPLLQVTQGTTGPFIRTDLDVDRDTLFQLNDFEARARHRKVSLRIGSTSECWVGEMNALIGLGAGADPDRHVGKVRISFHDVQSDDCG